MIQKLLLEKISALYPDANFSIESPQYEEQGDYSTNIALVAAKAENKNPKELAEEVVKKLSEDKEIDICVSNIQIAGPGFINFFLKTEYLVKEMQTASEKGKEYGTSEDGKGRLAIVEYSSPNIAKPFTIGHFRSTIIGDAVANLLAATGWKVLRDNHIGDWGTQFGKQIYAIKAWGDIEAIEKSENPVKELVDLYVKFHKEAEEHPEMEDEARAWFKKLEDGDQEARELWEKCIAWSWKEFSHIYDTLDVHFSQEFNDGKGLGESFFEDKMQAVVEELEAKNMLKEGEGGAKLVFFPDEKYPPSMILKSDGATLYHTRDLATDKYRHDTYQPDLIVNEVGAEQTLYFRQLYEMEKLLGWYEEDQRVHVKHGLIRFKEGKMSTRKGNVIWLADVLSQAIDKAAELGDEKSDAQTVGIGALKYNDLKRDPTTTIAFDWDEILNMQGNSGPYLQYTYARTRSVLSKSDISFKGQTFKGKFVDEELSVMRHIVKYPETVQIAAKTYSPNLVCNYLYELASKYNAFYAKHKIINDVTHTNGEAVRDNKHKIIDSEKESYRVELTRSVSQILENGLALLGIQAPEQM